MIINFMHTDENKINCVNSNHTLLAIEWLFSRNGKNYFRYAEHNYTVTIEYSTKSTIPYQL